MQVNAGVFYLAPETKYEYEAAVASRGVPLNSTPYTNPIRASIHYEYDFPQRIGAIPSGTRLMAPMAWGGIVLMMNTRRDSTATSRNRNSARFLLLEPGIDPNSSRNRHSTTLSQSSMKRELYENSPGNQVDHTNSFILQVENMPCTKLHCQKGFNLIIFSYEIGRRRRSSGCGSAGASPTTPRAKPPSPPLRNALPRSNMAYIRQPRPDLWPWLAGGSPENVLRCLLFAWKRRPSMGVALRGLSRQRHARSCRRRC